MTNTNFSYPRTLQGSIRRCSTLARLHSEKGLGPAASEILSRHADVMALLWNTQAQMAAHWLPKSINFVTHSDAPGYVFVTQEETSFAVPFFLVDIFPSGALLSEINELAKKVRVAKDSMICLSGSGCSLGSKIPIGDLDFCEYLNGVDESLAERLIVATRIESSNLVCMRVTLGPKMSWRRPWNIELQKPTKIFFKKATGALLTSKHRKIDYIAQTKSLGVLEVTNKLVAVDFAYSEIGEASSSFSMQEVPVGDSSWTPRNLSNPIEVGRYVTWLMSEIRAQISRSKDAPRFAVKALRRALPLARILLAGEEAETLRQLLLDKNGGRLAALHDRCTLFKVLEGEGLHTLSSYQNNLRSSILALRNGTEVVDAPFDALTASEEEALNNFAIEVRTQLNEIVTKFDHMICLS